MWRVVGFEAVLPLTDHWGRVHTIWFNIVVRTWKIEQYRQMPHTMLTHELARSWVAAMAFVIQPAPTQDKFYIFIFRVISEQFD